MRYRIGDKVICHVSIDRSVIFDTDFNDPRYQKFNTQEFEIIGTCGSSYVILVPKSTDSSFKIKEKFLETYNVLPKFLDSNILFIKEESIGGVVGSDSAVCCCCKQSIVWAQPNQEDGRFACYVCRTDPRYVLIYNLDIK